MSLQELEEQLITHPELKVPCKNIRTVAFGGYISTIFGWSLAWGPKVAYNGNTLCLAPFEAISTPQDDSRQCEHLLSQEFHTSRSDLSRLISS